MSQKIQDLHQETSFTRIQPESGFGDVGEGGIVLGMQGVEFSGPGSDGQIPIKNDGTGQIDWVTLLGLFGSVISPPQLTANTNDWSPTGLSSSAVIRVDVDAAHDLTGIVAPAATGQRTVILLANVSAFVLTLTHNATSAAANRFQLPGDVDVALPADGLALLWYDATSSRWRLAGGSGGSGGGTTWYEGAGAPSGGTGIDGDFYLNVSNGDVYEKVAGSWGSPVGNIRGPIGPIGPDGPTGPTGPALDYFDDGNTGAALSFDFTKAVHRFRLTSASVTLTPTSVPAAGTFALTRGLVVQDGTGGRKLVGSWWTSITWVGGSPILQTAPGSIDEFDVWTNDGGSTYFGIFATRAVTPTVAGNVSGLLYAAATLR